MRYTRETLTCVAAGMMATVMAAPVGQSHSDAMQAKDKKPPQEVREHVNQWEGIDHAVAVVRPTKGNSAKGTVWFTQTKKGVRVEAKIRGLDPQSKHAFHIHKYGDATAADATSAGGHYDPDDTGHHARSNADVAHHAGDLGNLQADTRITRASSRESPSQTCTTRLSGEALWCMHAPISLISRPARQVHALVSA